MSATTLKCFNSIKGISYPKNKNYLPYSNESDQIKNALEFLSNFGEVKKVLEIQSASKVLPTRNNRGSILKKRKIEQDDVFLRASVRDLFFYPKYDDCHLIGVAKDNYKERDNSEELLEKFVARHLFLVFLCFPNLNGKKEEICTNFILDVSLEWGFGTRKNEEFSIEVSRNLVEFENGLSGKAELKSTPQVELVNRSRTQVSSEISDEFSDLPETGKGASLNLFAAMNASKFMTSSKGSPSKSPQSNRNPQGR